MVDKLEQAMPPLYKRLLWVLFLQVFSIDVFAQGSFIKLAYLEQEQPVQAALSNLDPKLADEGSQGASLAVKDNNTTGSFTGHQYELKKVLIPVGSSAVAALQQLIQQGYRYIMVKSSATTLQTLSPIAEKAGVLLFNIAAREASLRNAFCSANTLHIIPSYAMQADALAQFMLKKRWSKTLLIKGTTEQDKQFAAAIRRAAKRFGLKIIAEKTWGFEHDARRTAQAEIPVFTQSKDYDLLIVADVRGLFGEYLSYNTSLARPIAGTQGLVARGWHKTHERWGAAQLQRRFYQQANRSMTAIDYAAWLAVRAVGEAVSRSTSSQLQQVKEYMLSESFGLAGFKGNKLNFRGWNQQLRQPVLLTTERSLVAVMPLREILHPHTYLDTLGYDQAESTCRTIH